MIAALPMYDRPETAAANDALWAHVARHLDTAPARLDRTLSPDEAWTHPDLLLSQTCGLPFSLGLHRSVQVVGSPDFGLPDCPAGTYCSVVITRAGDQRPPEDLLAQGAVLNDRKSQSGHNALHRFAQGLGVSIGPAQISGAHLASARAVADGTADIAAIDANTWRMIARWDPWADRLTVIARTPPTPAMPYICGPSAAPGSVHAALKTAIAMLSPSQRDTLGLYGLVRCSAEDFLAVPQPPV